MGWMSKLISRHNGREKCLVCEKIVGKDAAVVEYRYDGGMGKAFLCDSCEKEFGQTQLSDGDIDEAI
jgi:hypothetical protein